ncbi:tRNA dimethylallyltransferase [Alphaproteobacteria bacterium]|nr:tRNA dimethylallyltransferase [Alphaproteobacteria bacterium]
MSFPHSRLIFVAGPTASGKSFLAIKIADFLNKNYGLSSEIINSDGMQLYNELKILTAFPSDDYLARVRHNLFGVLSPNDSSSIALWWEMATQEIKRIHSEQNVAIICGGTGFYMKALLNGIVDIPEIPSEIRNNVRDRFLEVGRDQFFDELKKMDVESLVSKGDTQRLLRAYEIALFTGKPLSHWWSKSDRISCTDAVAIVLNPEREKLKQVCYDRICSMIQNGAIEEVEDFVKRYENYSGPLANAVGYQEISSLLRNEISLQDCIEKMHTRTRQYAKRQSTWFRNQMKEALFFNDFGQCVVLEACNACINGIVAD